MVCDNVYEEDEAVVVVFEVVQIQPGAEWRANVERENLDAFQQDVVEVDVVKGVADGMEVVVDFENDTFVVVLV